jgi:hypothetical protein
VLVRFVGGGRDRFEREQDSAVTAVECTVTDRRRLKSILCVRVMVRRQTCPCCWEEGSGRTEAGLVVVFEPLLGRVRGQNNGSYMAPAQHRHDHLSLSDTPCPPTWIWSRN